MKAPVFRSILTVLVLVILLTSCKRSASEPPAYDSADCTQFSCPLHKDHTSASMEYCADCGLQFIRNCYTPATLTLTPSEKQAQNDSLSGYLEKIFEHSNVILRGDTITKSEQVMHVREASRNVEKLKWANALLKNAVPEKYKSQSVPHHDIISELCTIATYRLTTMSEELAKASSDQTKLREMAEKLSRTIKKLEKERRSLEIISPE